MVSNANRYVNTVDLQNHRRVHSWEAYDQPILLSFVDYKKYVYELFFLIYIIYLFIYMYRDLIICIFIDSKKQCVVLFRSLIVHYLSNLKIILNYL